MTEPDPHVDMSTSDFRIRLVKEGLERAHLFRNVPSDLNLVALGIQRPWKESEGVVHFFCLDEELLGHGDNGLVGLLRGRDKESKVITKLVLSVSASEFFWLELTLSCRGSVIRRDGLVLH